MANFYGVKEGKTPGVYETWKECEEQIKGYSNAVYKKFKTREEALEFIEDGVETKIYNIDDIDGDTEILKNIKKDRSEKEEVNYLKNKIEELEKRIIELEKNLDLEYLPKIKEEPSPYREIENQLTMDLEDGEISLKENEMIAYVDGSYKNKTKEYSYGMIIFTKDSEEEYYEKYKNEFSEMRNVAGEIQGAMKAMELAVERGKTKLYLHYDYMGIEKWAREEWKANKKGTQKYRDYYLSIKDKIEVVFIKVLAHSGDKYNEVADSLAKKALEI